MTRRLKLFTVSTAVLIVSVMLGLFQYHRFATTMERNGREQSLTFIMFCALSQSQGKNDKWPTSFQEFKGDLYRMPTTKSGSMKLASGFEVFRFANEVFAYSGGGAFSKSDSSNRAIVIIELTPSRDGTVGLVTSDRTLHFIRTDDLPAFSENLMKLKRD